MDVGGARWSETPGYGRRDGNAVEFVFEYPDGPLRTTFRWEPESKTWRWQMRQKDKSGAWADFAITLTAEAAPSKQSTALHRSNQSRNGEIQ